MGRRIRWLALVLVACFAVVLIQLWNVQFRKAQALDSSSENPLNVVKRYDNQRGMILAADGQTVLAESKLATSGPYHYMRVYPTPDPSVYAPVVGYSSIFYGTSGIEYQYDRYLVAHSQPVQSLSQLLDPPPATTDNVVLTIEPYLQQAAMQALRDNPHPDKDGAVVVIDPHTGAILAMASNPSFDPNLLASPDIHQEQVAYYTYSQRNAEGFIPLRPIATGEIFPPGSTAKVITTTAVYNLRPQLANFSFPTAGCLPLPQSNRLLCNDAPGPQGAVPCGGTMQVMLPESCDPGYGALGIALGADALSQQAAQFGYNAVPPIDLPGVVRSNYPTAAQLASNQLGAPGLAYSAIGQQDVAATALQNAMVAAGVANGGVVMTPHLLDQVRDAQGRVVTSYQPTPYLRAASQQAAAQVVPLMEAVATNGTAAGIFPPQWQVAAKTGTAQTGRPDPTANTDDWMIAFAPASNPKVAVAVVVPYQEVSTSGAEVAGPIMRAVLQAALNPPPGTGPLP